MLGGKNLIKKNMKSFNCFKNYFMLIKLFTHYNSHVDVDEVQKY